MNRKHSSYFLLLYSFNTVSLLLTYVKFDQLQSIMFLLEADINFVTKVNQPNIKVTDTCLPQNVIQNLSIELSYDLAVISATEIIFMLAFIQFNVFRETDI